MISLSESQSYRSDAWPNKTDTMGSCRIVRLLFTFYHLRVTIYLLPTFPYGKSMSRIGLEPGNEVKREAFHRLVDRAYTLSVGESIESFYQLGSRSGKIGFLQPLSKKIIQSGQSRKTN